jgi:hypothetical protein
MLVVDIGCFVPPLSAVFGVAMSGEGCLVNIKDTPCDLSAMIKVMSNFSWQFKVLDVRAGYW